MLEDAFDVEAAPVGTRDVPRRDDVHDDPDERHDEHREAFRPRRRDEPAHTAVDDQAGEHEQGQAVRLRAQRLHPPEAEGEVAARRPCRQAERDERQDERARVGQHVSGVGEERQRVREDPDDDDRDWQKTLHGG